MKRNTKENINCLYGSTAQILILLKISTKGSCAPGSQDSHMSQNQPSQKNGNKIIVRLLHDNLVIKE
jgi:hypothetical protein